MLTDLHVQCLLAAATSRIMIERSWLLDALTVTNTKDTNIDYASETPLKIGDTAIVHKMNVGEKAFRVGQVVGLNNSLVGIVLREDQGAFYIPVLSDNAHPVFHRLDTFNYAPEVVKPYLGVNPCSNTKAGVTTVGRFIENMIVLQYPTNFRTFEYINDVMVPGKLMQMVTDKMTSDVITVEEYKTFMDNLFYLNHITEISVPSMTERSLLTDPRVAEVKAKFIAEHKDQLKDPLVLKELEDQLRALDKEWLGKGTDHEDPSVVFFDGLGKDSWDLDRKKLFLTVGGIPAFDESSGKFDFIQNSLTEGWVIKALPSIANEIRKGSYERGRETAKGGAETKLVMRVFQDLSIAVDDCGTKRTLPINFGGECRVKDFIGRTVKIPGGQDVIITEENAKQFDGKVVNMYSPMFCETKYNFCYKCCGQRAKTLGAKMVGIQVIKITSKFMNTAMKNMHGTTLTIIQPKLESIFV